MKIWSRTRQKDFDPKDLPLKDLIYILDHIGIDVSDCDICCRKHEKHDPAELVIIHNPILHEDYYHVRCPKCWQHTDFYRTREEAIKAWDTFKR